MKEVSKDELEEGKLYIGYRWNQGSYKEIAPFTIEYNNPFEKTLMFFTDNYWCISYEGGRFHVEESSLEFSDDLEEESEDTIFFELELEEALDFFDFV